MKVWIDGAIVDGADARVPVDDHGLLYGDGVFEGIRVRGGCIFRLDRHLERLLVSAKAIGLELPWSLEEIRAIVVETVRVAALRDAYIRLLVTRGSGPLGVDPSRCLEPRLVCIVDELRLYPPEIVARGLDLVTVSVRRASSDAVDPRVKSLNYLTSVLAKREARMRGADEALLLSRDGRVAETSVANVFVYRGGVLSTPPASDGALEGITRGAVLELARGLGIDAAERTLGRVDLIAAREAFVTGTGAGIIPIRSLDGQPLLGASTMPGPIYEKLAAAFVALAREDGVHAL